MCLRIAVERPNDVLASGVHCGFEWMITHNGMGFRCGYVRVPVGHPWHGADIFHLDVDVHGGLTFGEPDVPCGKGGPDDAYWVGFDCAHGGDAPDPDLPRSRSAFSELFGDHGKVRSTNYVRRQCESLCEQAAEVGPGDKESPGDVCESLI